MGLVSFVLFAIQESTVEWTIAGAQITETYHGGNVLRVDFKFALHGHGCVCDGDGELAVGKRLYWSGRESLIAFHPVGPSLICKCV